MFLIRICWPLLVEFGQQSSHQLSPIFQRHPLHRHPTLMRDRLNVPLRHKKPHRRPCRPRSRFDF